MEMINYKISVKPDETIDDIIAELCDEGEVDEDEPFAFGAIMVPSGAPGCYDLKINCLVPRVENPYTIRELIDTLFDRDEQKIRYVQPPLEKWLAIFKPMICKLVERAYPFYSKLIPTKDDLLSTMYLTIVTLYNKGYYLHRTLIYKSFINNLNMECRKIKHFQYSVSLDEPNVVECEGGDLVTTIADTLEDKTADFVEERELDEEQKALFGMLKEIMLKDMSEFQFNRILSQLKHRTLDSKSVYLLSKYRRMFRDGQ
jgi:hypothetical protein